MKWIHVRENKNRFNCPASYVEDYNRSKEVKVGESRWVFWSPDENETPKDVLLREKRILRISAESIRKNKGVPPAGYYEATILMVQDSEKLLEEELLKKRISVSENEGSSGTGRKKNPKKPYTRNSSAGRRTRNEAGARNMKDIEMDDGSLVQDVLASGVSSNDENNTPARAKVSSGDRSTDPIKIQAQAQAAISNVLLDDESDLSGGSTTSENVDDGDFSDDDTVPKTIFNDVKETLKAKESQLKAMKKLKKGMQSQLKEVKEKEVDHLAKLERDLKAKLESELKAKLEREMKAKLESELKAKLECEMKAKLESEMKAKLESDIKAELETELKAKVGRELKERDNAIKREMQRKLEEKDDELRKARESENRMVSQCLSMVLNQDQKNNENKSDKLKISKSSSQLTSDKTVEMRGIGFETVRQNFGEPSSLKTDDKSSGLGTMEFDDSWNEIDSFSGADKSDDIISLNASSLDHDKEILSTPDKGAEKSGTGQSSNTLSAVLETKRKMLLQSLSKKKAKKMKKEEASPPVVTFNPKDWENEAWKLTTDQEIALLKLVKPGEVHDSKLVKKASDLLWEREDLALRSAKGKGAFGNDESPRQECTPQKKSYLLYLLNRRVQQETKKKTLSQRLRLSRELICVWWRTTFPPK